jgi:hypothetical protein
MNPEPNRSKFRSMPGRPLIPVSVGTICRGTSPVPPAIEIEVSVDCAEFLARGGHECGCGDTVDGSESASGGLVQHGECACGKNISAARVGQINLSFCLGR